MTSPETKAWVSKKRKRNYIAKRMLEEMPKKIHRSAKDVEKQKKWRMKNDPEGDYDSLDAWLVGED